MRKTDFYYDSKPKSCKKYAILLILITFSLSVTVFGIFEVRNFYSDQPTVMRILIKGFRNFGREEPLNISSNKIVLVNFEGQQNRTQTTNSERQARAATNANNTNIVKKSNSYYEEQTPVVVYAKTDTDRSINQRQMPSVLSKQYTDEEDYGTMDDSDYLGYYRPQNEQPDEAAYSRNQQNFASDYDDGKENFANTNGQQQNLEVARASQYNDYGNYYRQYQYATPPTPVLTAGSSNNKAKQQQNREPYPNYMDDYDYLPDNTYSPVASPQQTPYKNRPQYHNPSTSLAAVAKPESNQQMDFLNILKSIKTMWDLYNSFSTSWNTIAEKRNREQALAKQKYKQMQQTRINSRKPLKFNSKRNKTATTTAKPKKETVQSSILITTTPATNNLEKALELKETTSTEQKVEPRKNNKTKRKETRDKRQAAESTNVSEARYIKGDPLKGYYDFVITEGSYKFWAAFQVGTAILIIYSTFAAIYYSKVNPLVSDYDYTDYLGGARSLSGGDEDFVDDFESDAQQLTQQKSWLEWWPRTGHSLKFILDAIDKLPTDHTNGKGDNNSSTDKVKRSEFKKALGETVKSDDMGAANNKEFSKDTNRAM